MTSSQGELHNDRALPNSVQKEADTHLAGFLSAHIKTIEHRMLTNSAAVEEPGIYPVPKDAAKETTIVFVALLTVTTFATFLLEGIRKDRARAS